MIQVFVGVDQRQPVAFTVCASSILRHAKKPVSVSQIRMDWIPGFTRMGLTTFSLARYMVPWYCDYEGRAIFMDGDILVRGDVNELLESADPTAPVSVAKHVARFEWPSVMVFNNELCKNLTIEYVNNPNTKPYTLEWASKVGDLPPEWNHCVLYEPHREDAKLIHFTCGLPSWPETRKSPHAEKWIEEWNHVASQCTWEELMGNSVHRKAVERLNRST